MSENGLGGYFGKLLRVNLTDQKIATEDIDEAVCRKFLGGAGFVAYYSMKEIPVDKVQIDLKVIVSRRQQHYFLILMQEPEYRA